jgi:hypothetical protein
VSGWYAERIEKWRADSKRIDDEINEERKSKLDAVPPQV